MQRKRKRLLAFIFGFFVLACILSVTVWYVCKVRTSDEPVTLAQLEALSLDHIGKVMIVAHPDDETYWGGGHLAQEPYLVVCLTHGKDPVRRKEFEQAVGMTGSIPLILNYPDKEWGMRSSWAGYLDDIQADISTVLGYKQWDVVATHNPDGEYGHIQHKRTSSIVTETAGNYPQEQLFYFGRYETVKELAVKEVEGTLPARISEELYGRKQQMVSVYKSQKKAENEFCHMFPYEEWYAADR